MYQGYRYRAIVRAVQRFSVRAREHIHHSFALKLPRLGSDKSRIFAFQVSIRLRVAADG